MEEVKYLYVLHAVEARNLSETDIQRNFEIYKIKYNPKDTSFEYYKSLEQSLGFDVTKSISSEIVAYFYDEKDAIECAELNIGDYNDGGVFNYAVVEKLPIGVIYPIATIETEYWLFKFDRDSFSYKPISFDTDDMTKEIQKKFDMFLNIR